MMMFVAAGSLLSAQGLKVEPGTCIKVETGTTLDISVGGDLFLESDATGDASLIDLGNVSFTGGGKAIVQRYMPGNANAWHMISAPVNAMPIAGSDWAPDTDEDLYLWYEPSPGIWVNYKNQSSGNSGDLPYFDVANGNNNFSVGQGYIVNYNTANPTNNFQSSALNTGNVNITLYKSTTKNWNWNAGWNLIGNPYPSGIDWSTVTKSDIVTEVWAQVYDSNKDGGAGYEPVNGTIAPGQGFFVQAVNDEVQVALQPAHQVHASSQAFMKSSSDKLVVRLSSEANYDETRILIHENSVPDHDFYDATKLFSYDPQMPQLYTLASNGRRLSINSLNEITALTVIPLSIRVQGNSIMSISLTDAEGTFEGPEVILKDMQLNIQHNLSEMPTYNFTADAGDDPNRFVLKFGAVGVDKIQSDMELIAWMQYNRLYILNPGTSRTTVDLYNIHGQVILSREIGQGLQSIPVHVVNGTYVVMLRTDQYVATRKIVIQQ